MTGVQIYLLKLSLDSRASIGIGALIIFIAMILVAGITASVLIQTMNQMQEQALKTGQESLRDVSGGVEVTHVTGYYDGTSITQLAVFTAPTAASDDIDLTESYISLSDSSTKVILNYTSTIFSSSVSSGLFGTLDDTSLTSSRYGVMIVRDTDSSCTSTSPTINDRDLVVLLINTSKCFSGISTNTEVFGNIYPEYGISGIIGFTTPSAYIDTVIDLQP